MMENTGSELARSQADKSYGSEQNTNDLTQHAENLADAQNVANEGIAAQMPVSLVGAHSSEIPSQDFITQRPRTRTPIYSSVAAEPTFSGTTANERDSDTRHADAILTYQQETSWV